MSGIAGLLRLNGAPASRADVDCMLAPLAHRGPDGAGVQCAAPAGLGHRLLHTTPESLRERQPLASADGSLLLTADARIDNRAELIRALDLADPAAVITDADLILAAYDRWGEHCPERLLGDFAFAIWDARRQSLFCARDHFGVKPFYYHHAPGRLFALASEIKGLLALAEVPRGLNETRIADYLVPLLEDKAITFYAGVVRLPPAHRMTVSRAGVRLEQYWALDPGREIRLKSDAEYAEAFREIFTEAVRCRLRSASPVGAMLSGGLDSSSIVCLARRLLGEHHVAPLHTFSAVFPDVPQCDERRYIDAVVSEGGLEPHYLRGDLLSPLGDLDRVLAHEDEPFYAPNLFLHWELYRAAQAAGVRVLCDGVDGDTTVSHGLARLAELAASGRWPTLAAETFGLSRRLHQSPWRLLWRNALRPFVPQRARATWRWLRGRSPIINRAFADRTGLARRLHALDPERATPARTARDEHWRRLTSGLVPFALEIADKAAAAFAIEPRYPFFDRRLAQYCLALPSDQKLRSGFTRLVLRHALHGILTDAVRRRGDKSNLAPNFRRALLHFGRATLEEVIGGDGSTIAPYVDLTALRRQYARYAAGGAADAALPVWTGATLALWLSKQRSPTHAARSTIRPADVTQDSRFAPDPLKGEPSHGTREGSPHVEPRRTGTSGAEARL
ncbi:MAG: asparagine synthase (glutamine-hydrolyzing) [Cyanobacteria bacterium 13_1_40CM_2_61_4]|nr:MAG: asparagine synthase (glutamine-hydrolyzing) [Cyanobacteria bacterium 13_1_40CM_2_61_4]